MTEFDKRAEAVRAALQEAVNKEMDKKRRLGHYAVVEYEGKVMRLVPEPPILGEWKLEAAPEETIK
jgi:hypothetical protein